MTMPITTPAASEITSPNAHARMVSPNARQKFAVASSRASTTTISENGGR
ncbi:MAG: hypothetical protein WCD52_05135 [Xanthobacteraceae bacterium]